MKYPYIARMAVTVAAVMLGMGLGTPPAQGQVDGFANNKINAASGWRVKELSDLTTALGKPLAGPGTFTYQIELDEGAWFRFATDSLSTKHYLTKIDAFYQLYTDVNNTNANALDQRIGTQNAADTWDGDVILNGPNQRQAFGWKAHDNGYDVTSDVLFPGGTTGRTNVGSIEGFKYSGATPLAGAGNTVLFGFHVSWTDTPFEFNGTDPTQNTAKVYWQTENGGPPIPEPAFYQMSALLLLGGTGLFLRARHSRKNSV